jgi:hypothetical protein
VATVTALDLVAGAVALWLAIGTAGLVRAAHLRFVSHALFPAGAIVGIGLAADRALLLGRTAPNAGPAAWDCRTCRFIFASMRCRRSSCFCLDRSPLRCPFIPRVISAPAKARRPASSASSITPSRRHGAVMIADDAYAFMVAWESMALASYFLVTTEHRIPEIRRAGFLTS